MIVCQRLKMIAIADRRLNAHKIKPALATTALIETGIDMSKQGQLIGANALDQYSEPTTAGQTQALVLFGRHTVFDTFGLPPGQLSPGQALQQILLDTTTG
jgi:hypothetical protein